MAKSKAERGWFSSRKKMDVVLLVLRGDDLDLVSREAGITAATVGEWRDQFVTSGQAGLKSRAGDGATKNSRGSIDSSEIRYDTLERWARGKFRPSCSDSWRRK